MSDLTKKINLRSFCIFMLGVYCILRGVAYMPFASDGSGLPKGLEFITKVFPIEVWGGIWLTVGIVCIIKAFSKYEGIAIPLSTGLMAGWGASYLYGFINSIIHNEASREWLTASSYLIPAIVIGILSAKGGDGIELDKHNSPDNK